MLEASVRQVIEEGEMDVAVGVLVDIGVGTLGVIGAVTIALMAFEEWAAREGRGEGQPLLAPRGARFGESKEVLRAVSAQAD